MKLLQFGVTAAFVLDNECPDKELSTICENECTGVFVNCVTSCESDASCTSSCNREFFACNDECPCHENCPDGCEGCEHYLCIEGTTTVPTTTTEEYDVDNQNVLILNNYVQKNYPIMVNFKGELQDDLFFTEGPNIEVQGGCSVKFRGEYWFFGGKGPHSHQAAKITGCEIRREKDLPFPFIMGACNTFQPDGKDVVYMCFGSNGYNACQKWDGMKYEKQPNAIHFHYDTRLSIYEEKPFALGHMQERPHGNKAEVFNFETNSWKELPEYPWEPCIFYYATVSLENSVIVLGGWDGRNDISRVAKFEAESWSELGNLQQPRHGHSAITNGKTFLVIGGNAQRSGEFDTERFTMQNGEIAFPSTLSAPFLDYYTVWPELFLVDEEFCLDK